jgi:hypothetical protein
MRTPPVTAEQSTDTSKHSIHWFVYQNNYDLEGRFVSKTLEPRQSFHKPSGGWTGYEAKCSCGWETKSGGAIPASIRREIEEHKWDVDPGC